MEGEEDDVCISLLGTGPAYEIKLDPSRFKIIVSGDLSSVKL